jgi:LmbE family N-acetylglucosaminyl deacetylase
VVQTRFSLHPRAWLDALLTYPRFLGTIKPDLMQADVDELAPRLAVHHRSWWPKKLERPVGRRILAISPHPDDESIGCGGFLLSHAGYSKILILNVYNGDGGGAIGEGPWQDDPVYKAQLSEMRRQELDEVAAMLEAKVIRFGISDCTGVPGPGEVAAMRHVLENFSPDIVLLPWFLDNHPHHRITNRIFIEAVRGLNLMVLAYEIWGLLNPNAFFDVTDVLDRKLAMIAIYASQLRTVDYVAYANALARTRAFHYPVRDNRSGAVEAFLALPSVDYCDLARLAPDDHAPKSYRSYSGDGV